MKRPRLQLLGLSLGALLLAACGASTPAPTTIPGATLNIQLSESSTSANWTLGQATAKLYQYTGNSSSHGDALATGSVDASGKGTLALPGEAAGASNKASYPATEAALWFAHLENANCSNTVTSSNAAAEVLLAFQGDFTTGSGGGDLLAIHGASGNATFDMLTYSTAKTTVSGNLVCGDQTYGLSVSLNAGWNIVEHTFGTTTYSISSVPLSTTVQFTRNNN